MKKITFLLLVMLAFCWQTNAQVTVGTGTYNNAYNTYPIACYYGYSYAQSIYTAAEINASGDITSISFEMSDSDAIPNSDDNIDLWIGHTTKSEFSSTTDWVDVSTLTQVITDGSLTKSGTTITFTFSSAFTYNGTDNIIIALDANEAGYDTSGDKIIGTDSGSNRTIRQQSDSANADPTAPPTGVLTPYIGNITFYGITQSCPNPSGLSVANITTTSADLGWTEGGTATTWNIEVVTAGTTPTGTATDSGVTTNPYSKTGLTAATEYEFYVQASCSTSDQSAWIGPFAFTTECDAFTVPYSENFDSTSTGSSSNPTVPNCWSFIDSGSGYGYVSSTGANSFYMYNSSDSTGDYILVSPETTSLSSGNNRIKFDVDGSTGQELIVGTMSDPSDSSTFTSIETITLATNDYESFIVDIPSGTDAYVALKHGQTGTYDVYYLDNIVVEEIPSCTEPNTLTAANIATTSADLGWTEGGTATTWNIEVVTAGTTPTGTATDNGVTTNPYSKTGLTAATEYEFYVQASCGGSDLSPWVGPFAFTTECNAFTVPYSENFDSTSTGSSSNPTVPNCWSFIDSGSGYGYVSSTGANSFYMYNNSDSTGDYILVSPETTSLSSGNNRIKFDVDGSTGQELIVGTMSDATDASTFTAIQTITLATNNYETYAVNIPSGTDAYVALKHGQTGTYDSYYLDNIVVEAIPTTPPSCTTISSPADMATDVSSVGTSITWPNNIDATGYKLKIGTTDGGSEFLAETDLGNVTSYSVSTMAYNTTYYVVLTPYNANGDATSCTSSSFTTHANPNYGGGPDGTDGNQPNSGGYYFANSTSNASAAASQPTYSWIDPVAASHTEITSWTSGSDDDGYFTIPDIGFDFVFYGNTYKTNNAHINSNGAIFFGTASSTTNDTGSSVSIVNSDSYANFIAGCWQDLDDQTDGKIYYGGDTDKFVVTWWKYHDYSDASEYITFQIILHSNGNIVIQYNDTESSADEVGDASSSSTMYGDALIGIENSSHDKGIQYRNNGNGGPMFSSPLALGFTTVAASLSVNDEQVVENFKYYPNPVKNTLTLNAKNNIDNVSMYNMLGQVVLTAKPNAVDSELDMSNLQSGTYFVQVTIANATKTVKVIKE